MLTESDIRQEIDYALVNKGWTLTGSQKNVFTEKSIKGGRADYVLNRQDGKDPLIIIEAKKRGYDLNKALEQAKRYAGFLKSPIAYASDGSTIKTVHLKNLQPLMLNGEEVDEFISESLALQYLHTNEVNTIDKKVIKSRKELINIFASANKDLRKEGLQAGVERYSEFCNILFLKIFSEEEQVNIESGLIPRIKTEFTWDYFKQKDGNELLSYVNDTVIKHFQTEYGSDIFAPLQIRNPVTLKSIIDRLDSLSLVDTNSDIKGDAFEYFLKAYLANQNKDLGEYFTPRHIVKTLVKLVNPRFGETVYDPFCGTGGMLIESFRHIYNKMPRNNKTLEQLKKETIYGSEITKNARITKMNMILTGDGHNNILRQDSLKNPSKKKHDVVITNMPFSLGNFDEYASNYKLGSANGNSLCIEHCFDAINPNSENGRIGVIVPEGILFDKKYKKLRKYIYENSYVKDIISLPMGAFKPYTDVKTSILYLTKVNQKKELQKHAWHFTVNNDGYALNTKRQKKEGENDLDIFLSFNGTSNEQDLLSIGFNKLDMKRVKENDYISIPNPYKEFSFNSNFEMVKLGDLIEEVKLLNTNNHPVWSVTKKDGFVSSQDQFSEQVFSKDTSKYKVIQPGVFAYNPSRINVGSIAFNNSDNIGCVSPMYITFNVFSKKLLPEYLYWLLQSKQFKKQIKNHAFGSVRQTVSFKDFCNIIVPLPSIELQKQIKSELSNYCATISNLRLVTDRYIPFIETGDYKSAFISDVCKNIDNGINFTADQKGTGVKVVNVTDLYEGYYVKTKKLERIDISQKEIKRFLLKDNDILFARSSVKYEGVGYPSLVDTQGETIVFCGFIVRCSLNNNVIIPEFLLYLLRNPIYRDYIVSLSNKSTITNITQSSIKKIKIPLPPIIVQREIVHNLKKEQKMIEQQKKVIKHFKKKMDDKLNSLWEQENKEEPLADKATFDMLIERASKPVQ